MGAAERPGSDETGYERAAHEASTESVIDAIVGAGEHTPILVDLDETLLLSNSTEEYLDSARPRFVGSLILAALGFVKPWRWFSPRARDHARDWFRVVAVTSLMPWTPLVWKRRIPTVAVEEYNHQLGDALARTRSHMVVVTTLGFGFIVRPLIERMPMTPHDVLASRFWSGIADRTRGKYARVESHLGRGTVARSIVVTDSPTDRDMLDAAHAGFLTTWAGARYRPALDTTYIPFVYLDQVKHPGRRFFLKTVIADDWLLAVLATSWDAPNPVGSATGLLLLMLGFWCIYELGYMENDRVAATREDDPYLHDEYHSHQVKPHLLVPWIWAVAFTAGGGVVLTAVDASLPGLTPVSAGLIWIGLLVATRAVFALFNRLDKLTRAWVYLALQAGRTMGVALVVPVALIGAIALASQMISRWVTYMIYRYGGVSWPGPNVAQLVRLVLFLVLAGVAAVGAGTADLVTTWQFGAIALWFAFRGRRGARDVVRSASFL